MNAQSLLDALFQSNPTRSTESRINHAVGPKGLGGTDSPLTGILYGLAETAGSVFQSGRQRVESGDPLAIGGLGALAGLFLGGRGGAVGGGALALLGSLAYSALKKSQGAGGSVSADAISEEAPLEMRGAETAEEESELENEAKLIVRAMVNAAKADGEIDGGEMERLIDKVAGAGADAESRDFLFRELKKPMDLDDLTRAVDSPSKAAAVYAASLLAIEVDTPAEVDYLKRLADGLELPPQVVRHIHDAVGLRT
jgi:uncharacterized membrane protein YebE (DUF533 family)